MIFYEFVQQLRESMEGLLARINARDCPTDTELERSLQTSLIVRQRGRRKTLRKLNEADAMIVDILCQEKAESACVYGSPADLSGYELWEQYEYTGMEQAVKDCWYWQLAYWIIEDVIDTAGVMNSGSNSVLTSPVKRLLSVDFTLSGKKRSRQRTRAKTTKSVRPSYIISPSDGLTASLTGRLCNEHIDVVHFNVSVLVGTKAVLPFMQQLSSVKLHKWRGYGGDGKEQTFKRNQITILESSIASIDREDGTHMFYRYGEEDAVIKLNLICEYIFNKNGYDSIKPESVKKQP